MDDYQQQVIDEQRELNNKLVELQQFTTTRTFRKLNRKNRFLLDTQADAMLAYNKALVERIADFEN